MNVAEIEPGPFFLGPFLFEIELGPFWLKNGRTMRNVMWKDPIVEEIRNYRDEYAKQFNYDLHAICQDIRKKQGQTGRHVVSLQPEPVKRIPRVA